MILTRCRSVKPELQCVLTRKAKKPSLKGQTDQQSNAKRKKNQVYMEEDQKCQVPISADKNCQAEKIKGPVKPKKDMQSEKPAIEVKKKPRLTNL